MTIPIAMVATTTIVATIVAIARATTETMEKTIANAIETEITILPFMKN